MAGCWAWASTQPRTGQHPWAMAKADGAVLLQALGPAPPTQHAALPSLSWHTPTGHPVPDFHLLGWPQIEWGNWDRPGLRVVEQGVIWWPAHQHAAPGPNLLLVAGLSPRKPATQPLLDVAWGALPAAAPLTLATGQAIHVLPALARTAPLELPAGQGGPLTALLAALLHSTDMDLADMDLAQLSATEPPAKYRHLVRPHIAAPASQHHYDPWVPLVYLERRGLEARVV